MAPEAAEALLFADALALDVPLRARVEAGDVSAVALDSAERLFRDLAMIEEHRGGDTDVPSASDQALHRLEAKLDLTVQLISQAFPHLAGPELMPVRISVAGVRMPSAPTVADVAALDWQPAEDLPLRLRLPLRRLARDGQFDWWVFDTLSPPLQNALSRHLFRRHRRDVALLRRFGSASPDSVGST